MDKLVIDFMKKDEIKKVAELSYMVGKLHDENLPKYFNQTSQEEHLRIIEEMQRDKNCHILVARIKDKVVGFACFGIINNEQKGYKVKRVGVIYNLGVDEEFRRIGVGKELVYKAMEKFREEKCEAVDLNVFWFNKEALEFYKKMGFEVLDVNLRKGLE